MRRPPTTGPSTTARLGIKSPSLYWHVKGKDQLFALVLDHVVGQCDLAALPEQQYPDLTAVAGEFLAGQFTTRFDLGLSAILDRLAAEQARPR